MLPLKSLQIDNYKCEACDATFVDLTNFYRHQRLRLQKSNSKLYKCDFCEKVFCFKIGVNRHQRQVHSSEGDLIPCDECEKGFYSQQNLNRHKKTTHRLEKFKCLECDKHFADKQYMYKHMREKHSVSSEPQNWLVHEKCLSIAYKVFESIIIIVSISINLTRSTLFH